MKKEEAEQAVLDWYREIWNGKPFISGKPWTLDPDRFASCLNAHKARCASAINAAYAC